MSTPALKLPLPLERFVASQVKQGTYRSRQAAIIAAVASEKRRTEQCAWLNNALQEGIQSVTAGVLDMESIIRRGKARTTARKRRNV